MIALLRQFLSWLIGAFRSWENSLWRTSLRFDCQLTPGNWLFITHSLLANRPMCALRRDAVSIWTCSRRSVLVAATWRSSSRAGWTLCLKLIEIIVMARRTISNQKRDTFAQTVLGATLSLTVGRTIH